MNPATYLRAMTIGLATLSLASSLAAQDAPPPQVAKLTAEPARITMKAGQTLPAQDHGV